MGGPTVDKVAVSTMKTGVTVEGSRSSAATASRLPSGDTATTPLGSEVPRPLALSTRRPSTSQRRSGPSVETR
jgi:hypothetical protein